jgi:DNA-binding transcriptional MerR regulator
MKEFNKALSNFITDAAAGGAVRHLADLGYSISEIADLLDYPISKEKIAEEMWKHFVNTGKICLEEPKTVHEKASFVKEQDSYGRISFRRVTEVIDNSDKKYVMCDFGKQLYKNEPEFQQKLNMLEAADQEYIRLLPWPLTTVYHELDDRMKRIIKIMK